jgi:sulfur carrier protein ThiS adenylyltransferase
MNIFIEGLEKYFTSKQLKQIRSVKVGIAGAGGLGSNCAFNLVRSGFSDIVICDFDVVEPANLNRQFYFLDQIGKPKVEMLAENLLRINPDVKIDARIIKLDASNIKDIYKGCDVVVEAFDKAEAKKMIAETWVGKTGLFVSASGLAGYGNSDRIKVRKTGKSFYIVGDGVSEANRQKPPYSPRVNIAAAKMADIILEWVLNEQTE